MNPAAGHDQGGKSAERQTAPDEHVEQVDETGFRRSDIDGADGAAVGSQDWIIGHQMGLSLEIPFLPR